MNCGTREGVSPRGERIGIEKKQQQQQHVASFDIEDEDNNNNTSSNNNNRDLKLSNLNPNNNNNNTITVTHKKPVVSSADILKTLFFILVWYTFSTFLTL